MSTSQDNSDHAVTAPKRKIVVRSAVATISLLCLAIGVMGFILAGRNFTFPSQDSELMPATMALDRDLKQPWLDFSGLLLLVGLGGAVLFPFSFRFEKAERNVE